jgi:PKD repeat protein
MTMVPPALGNNRGFVARRATTLVECVVSTLIVGVLLVAALNSAGSSMRMTQGVDDRGRAQRLAGDLMNEILLQAYVEPDGAVSLGLDAGENTGNRSLFDDVDDYTSWSASPPTDRSGSALAGLTGWTHSATVGWADATTLASTVSTNTGLKKITVTISKSGTTMASIVGYRSVAWVDTIPSPTDATDNHSPVAVATANLGLGNLLTGQSVNFSGSTSSDQDGDYLSYVWNFGDGSTATGATASHAYSAIGSYTCTLTVYDGRGGMGTSVLSVIVLL